MKLKERFEQFTEQKSYDKKNYNAEECEQIADDYAIEFAVWICNLENNYLHLLGLYGFNKKYIEKTFSELLEIFKKEKGL
jgi:hypothetical protein